MQRGTQSLSSLIQAQLNKLAGQYGVASNRLSSGLRVNSAADDASGLAIGSRLESFVRGSMVSQRNVLDASSYLQVYDGALSSLNDNLQRMRELAVQASNGTLTDKDRGILNKEFQQLRQENVRILDEQGYNDRKIFKDEGLSLDVFLSSSSDSRLKLDLGAKLRGVAGSLADIWQQGSIPAVPGSIMYSVPGIITAGPGSLSGTYNVNVTSFAEALDLNDAIGMGVFGTAATGAPSGDTLTNSNPSVITVSGTPTRGGYDIEVLSTAQRQINVITGVAATQGRNGGADVGSQNVFNVQFENGDAVEVDVGNNAGRFEQYSTQDFVNNFNAKLAGRVTATYDSVTQTLRYEGRIGEHFTVNNESYIRGTNSFGDFTELYEDADIFNTSSGTYVQESSKFTGYVNGQFFSSTTANVTSSFGGGSISFNVLSTGRSFVRRESNSAAYAVSNSNPNVAYQIGTTAAGTYNVQIDQLARGQRSVISNVDGSFGSLKAGTTPNNNSTNYPNLAASQNEFEVRFGDGSSIIFDVDTATADFNNTKTFTNNDDDFGGVYSAEAFVASLNRAANGRITATYDEANGAITLLGQEGAGNSFTIDFVPYTSPFDPTVNSSGNVAFNVSAANTVQTARNSTGSVNGTAFSTSSNSISSAGLSFRAISLGTTLIEAGNLGLGTPASDESFTINFGDGTASRSFNLIGQYTAAGYVTAFNAAAAGKIMATYNAGTGQIEYRGQEVGANKTYSVSADRAAFNTTDATIINSAADYEGSVNGASFSSSSASVSAGGLNFNILSLGSTVVEFFAGVPEVRRGIDRIDNKQSALREIDVLDDYIDTVSSQRARVGAYISRLDNAERSLATDELNLGQARGRIIDADFAKETAALFKAQLSLSTASQLFSGIQQNERQILRLIDILQREQDQRPGRTQTGS